jgi:hypothetical protein
MRIEEARFLKEKHLAASLYKYAAFTNTVSKEGAEKLKQNVEGQYWTLVNLKNAVVSLRPPSTFNDPFDSSFTFANKAFRNDLIAKSGHKPLEGAPMMPDAEASVSLPPPEDVWEQELQAAWEKDPTQSRTIRRRCGWHRILRRHMATSVTHSYSWARARGDCRVSDGPATQSRRFFHAVQPRHGVSEERPSAGGGRAVPPRAAATA